MPGVGVKRAEQIFKLKGYTWKAVVETFEEKGLTEEDALINARLARILTTSDYDQGKKEQILWQPDKNYEVNPSSGLTNEGDTVSSV